jgi:glucosamine-6-phosphate deaminase
LNSSASKKDTGMGDFTRSELYQWCQVPYQDLTGHPGCKVRFRLVKDSAEMGALMAHELVDEIQSHNQRQEPTRAIIPCGPSCWYQPFTELVNQERVSLKQMVVYHMDECLDWQGKTLPADHPFNFKHTMLKLFYDPVLPELAVREENRHFILPENHTTISKQLLDSPVDITYGGWGQDGHIAYNQARRQAYCQVSLEELRNSTSRIQENNPDTILALAHRVFGGAYQFVPPMSVTLGLKECLSARKIRLWSDTGAWKQTALRVALFGPLTPEYPLTLLQEHPDALLTATVDTARHPLSEHPEWELGV